jgi:hypothetical protein
MILLRHQRSVIVEEKNNRFKQPGTNKQPPAYFIITKSGSQISRVVDCLAYHMVIFSLYFLD